MNVKNWTLNRRVQFSKNHNSENLKHDQWSLPPLKDLFWFLPKFTHKSVEKSFQLFTWVILYIVYRHIILSITSYYTLPIEIPKKLTVSIFNVTVIIFKDMVESVTDDIDPCLARWAGTRRLDLFFGLCRICMSCLK